MPGCSGPTPMLVIDVYEELETWKNGEDSKQSFIEKEKLPMQWKEGGLSELPHIGQSV